MSANDRAAAIERLEDRAEHATMLPTDRNDLEHALAVIREQSAKLAAVKALADHWGTLADGDRYYAKRIRTALEATA